jgi:hypothetical protein
LDLGVRDRGVVVSLYDDDIMGDVQRGDGRRVVVVGRDDVRGDGCDGASDVRGVNGRLGDAASSNFLLLALGLSSN